MDYASFFFYLYRIEKESVGPVVKHQQATIELILSDVSRDIIDIVDRFLDTGIRIYAIAGTNALKEPVNTIAREMLAAIKTHVFQKVSQASLAILFLQTTHTLSKIEACPFLWPVVVSDIVCQAIIQPPYPNLLVYRYQRRVAQTRLCLAKTS